MVKGAFYPDYAVVGHLSRKPRSLFFSSLSSPRAQAYCYRLRAPLKGTKIVRYNKACVIFMLRISKLADYATVVMVYCARQPENFYTAKMLAEVTTLQLPTVSKVLKMLVRKNLLISHRGASGGYQLARPAQTINIAQIVAAVDGPLALTECNHPLSQCEFMKNCSTKHSWQIINRVIDAALTKISLAEMLYVKRPS